MIPLRFIPQNPSFQATSISDTTTLQKISGSSVSSQSKIEKSRWDTLKNEELEYRNGGQSGMIPRFDEDVIIGGEKGVSVELTNEISSSKFPAIVDGKRGEEEVKERKLECDGFDLCVDVNLDQSVGGEGNSSRNKMLKPCETKMVISGMDSSSKTTSSASSSNDVRHSSRGSSRYQKLKVQLAFL
jgi:hypothetical protein